MAISVRCPTPHCGKQLKAKDELAGKRLKCPGCGGVIQVPASERTQPAAKTAPAAKKPQPASPPAAAATPLEQRWQDSPLLSQKAFMVRQKAWRRKYGPDYYISLPGTDDSLGEANIRAGAMLVLMGLFNMHDFLPRWIEVSDADGTLFWMKIVKVVNNRYDLYDPARKELLASLKTVFSTTADFRLLDAKGADVGEVVAAELPGVNKTTYFGYQLKSADGKTLGDVTSEDHDYFRRSGKRSYVGKKGYVGTVAKSFLGDPRTKVLILAATLAARMEGIGAMQFDPMSVK